MRKAMDLVDLCPATSKEDEKHPVNRKNRKWHKRLQLRKTVVQPPAMQSEDKNGPKKIAEEWEQTSLLLSSQKPLQEAPQSLRTADDSRSPLRFTCSQCKDSLEYVPKDLVKHFLEKHRGSLPDFSCHMCTFSTHEFSYLQVHLLTHKDTFSSCSMCNDDVQRTWPEFSAHLTMYHCPNGKYFCETCQKFSTNDFKVFLEHIYRHNLNLEEADDVDQHKDSDQLSTTPTPCCQYCGFEASEKWLISKHVKVDHVCQGKEKRRVHSTAMKPTDTVPKRKSRNTRSSVRETCWLTQDCLSLPGREFLDKYCHLSDPQTTLEKTQQFLMQSVSGETDDQKWTNALKTVLSNVPQDISLYQSENGLVSNTSDLAVLTVKNKITVAPNGAAYAKRLKVMTPTEKKAVCPESAASDAPCDQSECESHLKDQAPYLQVDVSRSGVNEPTSCTRAQENRENQEFKTNQQIKEHGKKLEGNTAGEGTHISSDLKLRNESEEKTSTCKVSQRRKTQRRRQRRSARVKKPEGQALKIVLKKNPVKEKQWVSQGSVSADDGGMDGHDELSDPHMTVEEEIKTLNNVPPTAVHQRSTVLPRGPPESRTLTPPPGGGVSLCGSGKPSQPECFLSEHEETLGDTETKDFSETDDKFRSADGTSHTNPRTASVTRVKMDHKEAGLQKSQEGSSCHLTEERSPGAVKRQPVITPQGELDYEDFCLEVSAAQSDRFVEGTENRDVPAGSSPDLPRTINLPRRKAIQWSPPSGHRWQPVPKHQERTLKLVAINPSQLVKRPAGDQPVVVLNHPDADVPQVSRIMEVVSRYKEVQRVILSPSTLSALSAVSGEAQEMNDPTHSQHGPSSTVQERFTLKFKFRRLSRKKYEIVGAVSPSRDVVLKFSCWFCGRVFTSQETMLVHRQRHLMEWRRPKCENS